MIVGGTDAGKQLVPYYSIAERMFPILPDDVIIGDDTPVGTFGLAWYQGLDPDTGLPIFQVRDDVSIPQTPYIGFHEAGHAFQTIVARGMARGGATFQGAIDAVRERYWSLRGFPGTWWNAQMFANSAAGRWAFYPDESFADAFAQVIFGYVAGEWTNNYGLPLDVARAREFFKEIEREALGGDDMDEATTRSIARQEVTDALAAFAVVQRETGHDPIRDAFNDHAHYDVQKTRPITGPPIVLLGNEGR